MMRLRLAASLFIGNTIHAIGDLVDVPDRRGDQLIREGVAEAYAGDEPASNPDANPLGDTIHPAPPETPAGTGDEPGPGEPAGRKARPRAGRNRPEV